MKRRSFLQNVATTSAGASLLGVSSSNAAGANDRIRIGLIGCGMRGRYVATRMAKSNVQFVAVCDVFEKNRVRMKEWAGSACDAYRDFRSVIDRKDIDAVVVATPDHWHAIPTVLACQSGKDVYVEKPLAHNIAEGRAMLNAARENNRIVQTGLQQRSGPHFNTMKELIADGSIGNVRFVRVWNFRNRTPTRPSPATTNQPPAGLDWDMYLGPAPFVAYDRHRHRNFRRYWDYAGGIATNYGTHRFDSVRHVMSIDDHSPKTVAASGQRFELNDGGEDPDVVQMTFQYEQFVLSYEGCMMNSLGSGFRTAGRPYYNMLGQKDRPNGMAFYGTKGTLFADRLGFELYPELARGKRTDRIKPADIKPEMFRTTPADGRSDDSTLLHTQNFLECMRSRATPVADVAIGHGSSIIPHLGNIACRTGQSSSGCAERNNR